MHVKHPVLCYNCSRYALSLRRFNITLHGHNSAVLRLYYKIGSFITWGVLLLTDARRKKYQDHFVLWWGREIEDTPVCVCVCVCVCVTT